jgi:hypothetical protein
MRVTIKARTGAAKNPHMSFSNDVIVMTTPSKEWKFNESTGGLAATAAAVNP